jgi:hypothetical protein
MTLLHLRILDVSSDTPRSTCVHPLGTAIGERPQVSLSAPGLPRDRGYSGDQRQNCTRILPASSVVRVIAAFKTHNS